MDAILVITGAVLVLSVVQMGLAALGALALRRAKRQMENVRAIMRTALEAI